MNKIIVIYMLMFCTIPLNAQLFETATTQTGTSGKNIVFGGYLRASAYGGSNFYDYTNTFAEFSLQAKAQKGKAFLFTDLRFRTGMEFNEYQNTIELKEAYAAYKSTWFALSLGYQIITWGQADGFNPTNNLSPNNYFFLSANPDDRKLPNMMLKADFYPNKNQNIELIVVPFYRASVYRFDLYKMEPNISFTGEYQIPVEFKNASLVAKWNFSYPAIDFSFSWFRGYDPYYGFDLYNLELLPGNIPEITLQTHPYQKNTFGADLALSLASSWIFKAEMAYDITHDYEQFMYIPNPQLYYVMGLETNVNIWNIIAQYIGKYIFDYTGITYEQENPLSIIYAELTSFNRKIFYQTEKFNHALSLNISKSFFYENLQLKLSVYYNFTTEEYLIRPYISYSLTDNLSVDLGGMYNAGPDKSLFAYNADIMNGVFFEFKYAF